MDISLLSRQNPWWIEKDAINQDPKLKEFDNAPLKWKPRLLNYIDLNADAFYSIRGPRQVGKTTLVKMIIRQELAKKNPQDIFYYACDLVTTGKEFLEILQTYYDWSQKQSEERKLIIMDEVSRVNEWEYAYKQFYDTHSLKNKTMIFTGSSCFDIKHGAERLGGRTGSAPLGPSNKIFLPMKFSEYAMLRSEKLAKMLEESGLSDSKKRRDAFYDLFSENAGRWRDKLVLLQSEADLLLDEYFLTGGVMSAVNHYHKKKEIGNEVYGHYLQLFFGDLSRLSRSETTAKKILSAIFAHQGKHVGWTRLARETGISSSVTVSDYADVLQTLFVLNIYHSFSQDRMRPKHRSEKKLQVANPFFFHAFRSYLENPAADFFKSSLLWLSSSENKALMAEQVVGDHLARLSYTHAPSELFDQSNSVFYLRNSQGETIDFLVRMPDGLIPVEVKYQNTINSQDSRQIRKHPRGILVTRNHLLTGSAHPSIPISLFLLFI